jgi:hypothetical protein
VLGLLIASANGSYQTQSGNVQRMTTDIILLDTLLEQYGPEAQPARELLRPAVGLMVERIWRENSSASATQAPFRATTVGEEAFAKIQQLAAQNEVQRLLKSRSVELSVDVAQTRLLLLEHAGSVIPTPFLAVLIFWLSMIFASFGLFSRLNAVRRGRIVYCCPVGVRGDLSHHRAGAAVLWVHANFQRSATRCPHAPLTGGRDDLR